MGKKLNVNYFQKCEPKIQNFSKFIQCEMKSEVVFMKCEAAQTEEVCTSSTCFLYLLKKLVL